MVASDTGLPPKTSSTNILINVIDANDNVPVFVKLSDRIKIVESTDISMVVYQVKAEDKDSGANGQVNYEILKGNINSVFYINPITGDYFAFVFVISQLIL